MNNIVKKKAVLAVLFIICFGISWYCLLLATDSSEYVFQKKYTKIKSENLPKWMPTSWCRVLLKRFAEKKIDPNFDNNLKVLHDEIKMITWVKGVKKIYRDYRGNLDVDLEIRRPLCVIKKGRNIRYLDANLDLDYMRPLTNENYNILKNGEKLPLVIINMKENKNNWIEDLVDYIIKWNKETLINSRFTLNEIVMNPHRTNSYCSLTLKLLDKEHHKVTQVVWGISQNENALESRTGIEKWADFRNAVARGGYNDSLDLRYNVSKASL